MTQVNKHVFYIGLAVLAALGAGCKSDPDRTRATLLDDKVIAERVAAALRVGGPHLKSIKVQTDHGVVTLTGTVPSLQERARAESLAKNVDNVSKLADHLEVHP
jgi:hyperosmotically inducible periplasmic protein